MKRILPVLFIMMCCCQKDQSLDKPKVLSNTLFVCDGSLTVGTRNTNIASLNVVNPRSSYQLCGTSGEGFTSVDQNGDSIALPVVLPMADSSLYPGNLLVDGDSLVCNVYADTTYHKNFSMVIEVFENNMPIVYTSNVNVWYWQAKFRFNEGSKYFIKASLQ